MAMVGRAPTLEEVVPGYGQRRREGVSEVLQEALMMLVAPEMIVAKKFPFSKVKSHWTELQKLDKSFQKRIENWLLGKVDDVPEPSTIYRGVYKGQKPVTKKSSYLHGTPWSFSAARGGKGAFGDLGSFDVYRFGKKKNAVYYRGGSLAGDPLESTVIGSAKGLTWDELLTRAKKFYGKELQRTKTDLRRRGLEFSEQEAEWTAKKVVDDLVKASFEVDIRGKPGIWRGKSLPYELTKKIPKLRSYDDLERAVSFKRKLGFGDEDIPELKILAERKK